MWFSNDYLEEVFSRSDIISVISSVVNLKKNGSRYVGLCPFHNEKTASFSVSAENQLYYCFGCGAGGNVVNFVMQYENFSFQEAIGFLAERAGMALPENRSGAGERHRDEKKNLLKDIYRDAAAFYYYQLRSPAGAAALAYFKKRGLSAETIKKFGLGYAPRSGNLLYGWLKDKGYDDGLLNESGLLKIDAKGAWDRFFNRAMFPIMDIHKRVIAFGGRVMGEGEPKYLNSPESDIFDKGKNLYALYLAKNSKRKYFLLCEGYMDVIALHQAGFDCAVASLGTAFTSGHASLLKRYGKEVVITYDSDAAGVRAALRAIPILKEADISVRVLDMSPYKDPDEFINALGASEFEKRIEKAINHFLFAFDIQWKDVDRRDPEKVSAFQNAVAEGIAGYEDPITRQNYIEAVSRRYEIDRKALTERVNYIGGKGLPKPEKKELQDRTTRRKKQERSPEPFILSWIYNSDTPYEVLMKYARPEYFTDGLYRAVALELIRAKKDKTAASPSIILDKYGTDDESRARLSRLFMLEADYDIKTIEENLRTLKRNYVNTKLQQNPDQSELMELIKQRSETDREEICLSPQDSK